MSRAAELDVLSWDLSTRTTDSSGDPTLHDRDEVTVVSNPLIHLGDTQLGPNTTHVEYDYSWLTDIATGTFDTSFQHAVRTPRVTCRFSGNIDVISDVDVRLSIDAMLTFAHTPGDESGITMGFFARDLTTNQQIFNEGRRGGNLYLEPSAGTLSIQLDAILQAGVPYRLTFGATSDNAPDFLTPPTGTIDTSGYINFSISPVPSPGTIACLSLLAPALLRRSRR